MKAEIWASYVYMKERIFLCLPTPLHHFLCLPFSGPVFFPFLPSSPPGVLSQSLQGGKTWALKPDYWGSDPSSATC